MLEIIGVPFQWTHPILILFDSKFRVYVCVCVQQQPLAQSAEESQTSPSCCAVVTPPCCCRRAFRWSCWRAAAISASSEACRYPKPTVSDFCRLLRHFLIVFVLIPSPILHPLNRTRTRRWNGYYRIPSLRRPRSRYLNTTATPLIGENLVLADQTIRVRQPNESISSQKN